MVPILRERVVGITLLVERRYGNCLNIGYFSLNQHQYIPVCSFVQLRPSLTIFASMSSSSTTPSVRHKNCVVVHRLKLFFTADHGFTVSITYGTVVGPTKGRPARCTSNTLSSVSISPTSHNIKKKCQRSGANPILLLPSKINSK